MIKACDLKRGGLIGINDMPHVVEDLKVSTPSARGAASIYRFRFRNLVSKVKQDVSCKGDESFAEIDFERRPVQFLYREVDMYTFMDTEDYSQFSLPRDVIEDQSLYLVEDMEGIFALLSNGRILTVEMPQKVELKVVECEPVMKGATAASRSKPAKCQTGLTVHVPEYLEAGEMIVVDTATGEFVSRANPSKF
ncbi:MAG: elongation factor P [Kiritimatiellae bacterium]|nr:elongation factor P [Kiritimatiellia bacterium]